MMAVSISLPILAVWPRQILVLDSKPFCSFLFIYFETESLYAALAIVELAMWTRLDSNSQSSACHWHPSAGIKGVHPRGLERWLSG